MGEHGGKKYRVLLAMDGVIVRVADKKREFHRGYWRAVKGAFHLPSAAFPTAEDGEEESKITFTFTN